MAHGPLRLYLIEILHQTTTVAGSVAGAGMLYLIEILHQTTTVEPIGSRRLCCILSKFYIKPQPTWRLYHINYCCILSKFYIKPQRKGTHKRARYGCILSKFYIKPQHFDFQKRVNYSCILSKFYIKPQLKLLRVRRVFVVSYRNSTSNHNSEFATR